jgi:hypothetical protein
MSALKRRKRGSGRRGAARASRSRYYCIVVWQKGGLIPWFWGGHLKWGPATQAVFFMREEDAGHEARQIRDFPSSEAHGLPEVIDVARFNKKHGLAIAPQPELVRY